MAATYLDYISNLATQKYRLVLSMNEKIPNICDANETMDSIITKIPLLKTTSLISALK